MPKRFHDTKTMYLLFFLCLSLLDKSRGRIQQASSVNYTFPSASRNCPTLRQIKETLASIAFLNQQDCFNFMCSPKSPRSPSNDSGSRSSSQGCWFFTTGQINSQISPQSANQLSPQKTQKSAPEVAGQFQSIDDLKRVLGQTAQEVLDKSGNVIGVEIPETTDKGQEPPPPIRPTRPRPGPIDIFRPTARGSARFFPKTTTTTARPRSLSDVCCKTKEVYFINSTLVDYFGKKQTIAQHAQRGAYQFIRHGICGSQGACYGECVQNYVNLQLVVHPTDPGKTISYRFFKIPGYCSCRVSSTIHLLG